MNKSTNSSPEGSPLEHYDTPTGVTLQVDFAWSKFRNIVSEKNGDKLTPVYIQHFRPTKPQIRIDDAATNTQISTGSFNVFSIAAECTVHGETITIMPLKKWKTAYNYLSKTLSSTGSPVSISWVTTWSLKVWDFVCVDSATQTPIAKFSANWWAIKEVGNFYFEQTALTLSKEARDEIVTVGLTILYLMATRMNSPLNLVGAAFAKTGKVEEHGQSSVELEERPKDGTKHKQV